MRSIASWIWHVTRAEVNDNFSNKSSSKFCIVQHRIRENLFTMPWEREIRKLNCISSPTSNGELASIYLNSVSLCLLGRLNMQTFRFMIPKWYYAILLTIWYLPPFIWLLSWNFEIYCSCLVHWSIYFRAKLFSAKFFFANWIL